jgi:hypothetical protein
MRRDILIAVGFWVAAITTSASGPAFAEVDIKTPWANRCPGIGAQTCLCRMAQEYAGLQAGPSGGGSMANNRAIIACLRGLKVMCYFSNY